MIVSLCRLPARYKEDVPIIGVMTEVGITILIMKSQTLLVLLNVQSKFFICLSVRAAKNALPASHAAINSESHILCVVG